MSEIPTEHPRWPDGTPVYVGQRVEWQPEGQEEGGRGRVTAVGSSDSIGVRGDGENWFSSFRLDDLTLLRSPEGGQNDGN